MLQGSSRQGKIKSQGQRTESSSIGASEKIYLCATLKISSGRLHNSAPDINFNLSQPGPYPVAGPIGQFSSAIGHNQKMREDGPLQNPGM